MTSRVDPRHSPARAPVRPGAAEFVGSFTDPLTPLDPALPEIAFLGRSNVGKSSLLNALVGIKGLAKVSATPGKTQAMNIFLIGPDAKPHAPHDGVTRGRREAANRHATLLAASGAIRGYRGERIAAALARPASIWHGQPRAHQRQARR